MSSPDTDMQNKAGYPYSRLVAESHATMPGPVTDPRDAQITRLAEENSRLLSANGELSRQLERALNHARMPQDEKGSVMAPGYPSKPFVGPASEQGYTENRGICPDCGCALWRDGVCPECDK